MLTTIDYCTRWTKAIACIQCTTKVVTNFLESFILNHFGCPFFLVCDNGLAFTSLKFASWAFDQGIVLKFSSNYYPQGNGLAKSTNKNLLTLIEKLLDKNPKDQHTHLHFARWVDHTRHQTTLGNSPFCLIYGLELVFPVHLKISKL